jgi:hypothetical protein
MANPPPTTAATNLVGRHAHWYGNRGKEGGPIMAFYEGNYGRPMLLVLIDGKLTAKDAEGVNVE